MSNPPGYWDKLHALQTIAIQCRVFIKSGIRFPINGYFFTIFLSLLLVDIKLTIWNLYQYFFWRNIAHFLQQLNLKGLKTALDDLLFRTLMSEAPRASTRGIHIGLNTISSPLSKIPLEASGDRGGLSNPSHQGKGILRMPFIPALPGGVFWHDFINNKIESTVKHWLKVVAIKVGSEVALPFLLEYLYLVCWVFSHALQSATRICWRT